jgi:hypothetical protein
VCWRGGQVKTTRAGGRKDLRKRDKVGEEGKLTTRSEREKGN